MKPLTLKDILKGIAFSIGLVVVYFLIVGTIGEIAEYFSEKSSPLTFIIGLILFIIVWGLIAAFSKAVQSGFSIKDFLGSKNEDNDENSKP